MGGVRGFWSGFGGLPFTGEEFINTMGRVGADPREDIQRGTSLEFWLVTSHRVLTPEIVSKNKDLQA